MNAIEKRQKRGSRALIVVTLLMADAALIFLDNATGPLLPFTVFYIALLYFAMTRVGSTWAYLIALISAAGRTYTVSQSMLHGTHPSFIAWQFATSFSVLGLICFLLDRRSHRSWSSGKGLGRPGGSTDESASPQPSRRTSTVSGVTDRYIPMMILASLGFLAAFVPWIHSGKTPELYCMDQDNGHIAENPAAALPAQADAAPRTKVVLLTIDDGPADADVDASILDTLDRHLAKSIWFITCKNLDPSLEPRADRNLQTLQRLVKSGQIIGNHGYNHLNLRILQQSDPLRVFREIVQCSSVIRTAVDTQPVYFRAPWGDFTPEAIQAAENDGMTPMRWNLGYDSLFQFRRSAIDAPVAVSVPAMTHFVDSLDSGDIILLHDTRRTADSLDTFLNMAEARGFSFVLPGHRFSKEALAGATPRLGDQHAD